MCQLEMLLGFKAQKMILDDKSIYYNLKSDLRLCLGQ